MKRPVYIQNTMPFTTEWDIPCVIWRVDRQFCTRYCTLLSICNLATKKEKVMIYAIQELGAYDHIQLKVNGNITFHIKRTACQFW